ncbi:MULTISPECIES: hypothetical protein [Rhodopseudomonas]|uniref:hypothetical protein n=1 Tax=Rhodopseudomonas TaxID=1073 RepID=UPI00128BCDD6|nr:MULTISPECIES: hypothetical protein [Rhodopseudomonas]MDF3808830.1 hypothetical protein [Rhodopseudomonas sp. BAL398]WOK18564.1 hypothetical protein RBJ75_03280 [Rhodopseudomonas sp. BAL398]
MYDEAIGKLTTGRDIIAAVSLNLVLDNQMRANRSECADRMDLAIEQLANVANQLRRKPTPAWRRI